MHEDLLEQARTLLRLDPTRPKQANLRRAVSAAYYALFHFLTNQSTRTLLGTHQNLIAYRRLLCRAFVHGEMKAACTAFGGGSFPRTMAAGLPNNFHVRKEVEDIAIAFVDLQSKRHIADYDLSQTLTRADVIAAIELAQTAIDAFNNIDSSDACRKFFLVCLLAWRSLGNR